VFVINDATGAAGPSPDAAGHVSGWGLIKAIGWAPPTDRNVGNAHPTSGDFTSTATSAAKLTVAIDTLINPTTVGTDVAGPMADFDPTHPYVWPAVQWAGTYAGPTDAATLNADTAFDTNGFVNPVAGTFGWSLDSVGHTLSLAYSPTPVPEPGTLILTAAGFGLGWVSRRRRTAR
jgi:PEP-CTERM motif